MTRRTVDIDGVATLLIAFAIMLGLKTGNILDIPMWVVTLPLWIFPVMVGLIFVIILLLFVVVFVKHWVLARRLHR